MVDAFTSATCERDALSVSELGWRVSLDDGGRVDGSHGLTALRERHRSSPHALEAVAIEPGHFSAPNVAQAKYWCLR